MCDLATLEKSGGKTKHLPNEQNRGNYQQASMKRLLSSDKISECGNNSNSINNNFKNNQIDKNVINKKQRVDEMIVECFGDEDDFISNENYFKSKKPTKSSNVKTELFKTETSITNIVQKSSNNEINMDFATLDSIFEDELKEELANVSLTLAELTKPSFINSCCLLNIDKLNNQSELLNLSTCTHKINGQFHSMKSTLRQIKCMYWYQECVITDGLSYADAYIGNDPLEKLLDMSCKQAVELYKQSLLANLPRNQNQYSIQFELNRKKCENALNTMVCLMNLKYDLEKKKFCVYKIENIKYNHQ